MFFGDPVALNPTLDSGVIAMAQLASYRADTASRSYDVCIGHSSDVRTKRTQVNVENVLHTADHEKMSDGKTMGQRLRALRDASGLSLQDVADRAGYRTKSGAQRYFENHYDPEYLPRSVAEKLSEAFEGTPIGRDAIMALAGLPSANASTQKLEGARDIQMRRDLPVYGTALGAPRDFDGKAIEQTMLNTGDTIAYLPRPVALNSTKHAYALYVQGSSMAPRHEDGETLFVTDSRNARPPRPGDDVVVYLRDAENDDGESSTAVLVKRLVRRSGSYVELRQFNPEVNFKIDAEKVLRVDRVIPWSEILS